MERLKAFSVEKFTLDDRKFHTLTIFSAKYLLRVLLTQLGLYSLYAWPLVAVTELNLKKTLDFAVNRFLMKLFRSNNTEIIAECRRYFQFNIPSELIEKKKTEFEDNYNRCVLVLRDIYVRLS